MGIFARYAMETEHAEISREQSSKARRAHTVLTSSVDPGINTDVKENSALTGRSTECGASVYRRMDSELIENVCQYLKAYTVPKIAP